MKPMPTRKRAGPSGCMQVHPTQERGQVHNVGVQIDATAKLVLFRVDSHGVLLSLRDGVKGYRIVRHLEEACTSIKQIKRTK